MDSSRGGSRGPAGGGNWQRLEATLKFLESSTSNRIDGLDGVRDALASCGSFPPRMTIPQLTPPHSPHKDQSVVFPPESHSSRTLLPARFSAIESPRLYQPSQPYRLLSRSTPRSQAPQPLLRVGAPNPCCVWLTAPSLHCSGAAATEAPDRGQHVRDGPQLAGLAQVAAVPARDGDGQRERH